MFSVTVTTADEGWTIERFAADIRIEQDASLHITERIDVDFGALDKHGIFREIPVRYRYDDQFNRVYALKVESVTNAEGSRWPYTVERNGANLRIKVGDANRTVQGRQTYVITYRVEGALNAFADHDELYWNVNGADWPVPTLATEAVVTAPSGGIERSACFVGRAGSTEPCAIAGGNDRVTYSTARRLAPGEQLTVVTALRKGLVQEPQPRLERRARTFPEYFALTPWTVGGALAVLAGGLAFVARSFWAHGRDRRYTTLHYLTRNPAEETAPLFQRAPVVVEFQPPEKLRPAQMGVLLDEQADTKDVTATIVDLAVRGYLTITELPKEGWFGKQDWRLTRKRAGVDGLETYEATVLNGLFADGEEVKLSDLKNEFYTTLARAKKELYQDATARAWFTTNPETARTLWVVIGLVVAGGGVGLVALLGRFLGAGVVAAPVVLVGLMLVATAHVMPKRTARGSELLRRTLGFRRYIDTAEKDRQQFNERVNIFAEYLPYAIVFGSVEKWARAFEGLDTRAATQGWYGGTTAFYAADFSRSMESFSSNVSSTIASTPGGSGGSGFSGGAGGGGGGGGGGSW